LTFVLAICIVLFIHICYVISIKCDDDDDDDDDLVAGLTICVDNGVGVHLVDRVTMY